MKNKSSDPLENYIRQNSKAFDDKIAPQGVWEKIISQLNNRRILKIRRIIWLGLSIILLGALAYFLKNYQAQSKIELIPVQLEFAALTDFNETQEYYVNLIQVYSDQLKELNPDATILHDLSLLDKTDKELRIELARAEGEYKIYIVNALIQNYQTKISLLLQLLDQIKNIENINYEKI